MNKRRYLIDRVKLIAMCNSLGLDWSYVNLIEYKCNAHRIRELIREAYS